SSLSIPDRPRRSRLHRRHSQVREDFRIRKRMRLADSRLHLPRWTRITGSLTQHSTARDAANTAKLANARRLVLTHFSPGNEGAERRYLTQAAAVFDGRIVVAKDRQILTV